MRANVDISSPEFRERLVAFRDRAGLTVAELAARADLSTRCVSDIEKGVRDRAQERTLRQLAVALGVSYGMLVRGVDDTSPAEPAEQQEGRSRTSRRGVWIVAAAVVVGLVAVGLGFLAAKHSDNGPVPIFLTDFENVIAPDDPDHLGTIIANLLTSDLSESRYVRVLSSHGVVTPGAEGDAPHFREDSASIRAATRAGAMWKICGSILRVEPALVVTSRIEDITDGTVLASQEVRAAENETVFDVAHRLAAAVKHDLALPRGADTEKGLPLAPVTTASVLAYRHYTEGMDNLRMLYRDRARTAFRQAVDDDPNFAMAYAMLAHPDILLTRESGDSLIAMARRHSDGITRREALYIDAFGAWGRADVPAAIEAFEEMVELYPQESEAYRMLGRFYQMEDEPAKARGALEAAVRVDPFDGLSINRLAYLYAHDGNTDAAITLIDRYIGLAPSQANPYDTRGDLLAWSGRPDDAIHSYKMALERNPQFFPSIQSLGVVMTLTRRYDEAERYFRMMFAAEDPGARCRARWLLAAMDVYRGHLEAAHRTLTAAIASDRLEGSDGDAFTRKLCLEALIDEETGHLAAATAAYRSAVLPEINDGGPSRYISVLVRRDAAAAAAAIDSIDAWGAAGVGPVAEHSMWGARGWYALSSGDADAACAWFERAVGAQDEMWYRYPLGLAYLRAGRTDDAIRTFNGILGWYSISRLVEPSWSARTYYYLGRAYEEAGRYDEARRTYAEFLDVWKDADYAFEEIDDALTRVTTLAVGN